MHLTWLPCDPQRPPNSADLFSVIHRPGCRFGTLWTLRRTQSASMPSLRSTCDACSSPSYPCGTGRGIAVIERSVVFDLDVWAALRHGSEGEALGVSIVAGDAFRDVLPGTERVRPASLRRWNWPRSPPDTSSRYLNWQRIKGPLSRCQLLAVSRIQLLTVIAVPHVEVGPPGHVQE
jgi:hypothetical protein